MAAEESAFKDVHFLDYWRVIKSRKEIILAVTLLVVVTVVSFTFTRPKIYRSVALLEIRPDEPDFQIFGMAPPNQGAGYNPVFVKTQYEIIKARNVLHEVIESLNLTKIWGKRLGAESGEISLEDAYYYMLEYLDVTPYRDTALIAVRYDDQDRMLAAAIANAVSEKYSDFRLSMKRQQMRLAIETMASEASKAQDVLAREEAKLEEVRKELDISFLSTGQAIDNASLSTLEATRVGAKLDMLVRKARLDEVLALPDDLLMDAAPLIIRDYSLMQIKNALIDTEVSLRLQSEEFGPLHPQIIKLQAAVDELNRRKTETLLGLKKGLQADYEVARKKHDELDAVLKEARRRDIEDVGEKFVPFAKQQRIVELQRGVYSALQARIAQEGVVFETPITPVVVIEAGVPSPADAPVSPRYMLNIIASIFAGLALGIGMAYFIEYLDTSVKTVDDVEQNLGLPVVGVIPQKVQPLNVEGGESPHAEAYRLLRTNVQFANKGTSGGAFAVESGGVGEGKSTTLFNLAYVCAQLGDKVLIVDSDMRRPVQHTFFNISNRSGLTNYLMDDVSLDELIQPTPQPNLHLLPSGNLPRQALGIMDNARLRELVLTLKTKYDYVFFDSPPLMGVSDASIIASEVDGVLLVVQYRKYPRTMSARAKRMVENVGGNLLGVVLNNINIMRDDYYYYYHSYYSHYYSGAKIRGGEEPQDKKNVSDKDDKEPKKQVY